MKTLTLVAIGLSGACPLFAGGGGIVDFENFSNTLIYTNSVHNGPSTGLMVGNHAYYFALFSAPTNHTTVDATVDNGVAGGWGYEDVGTNTPTPGLMNGNYTTDPGVDVSFPSGFPANFVVAGWSANIGTTWADAKAWWGNGNPNATLRAPNKTGCGIV